MPVVTDRLVLVKCRWCGTTLARASVGAVVEVRCRECKLFVEVEVTR